MKYYTARNTIYTNKARSQKAMLIEEASYKMVEYNIIYMFLKCT